MHPARAVQSANFGGPHPAHRWLEYLTRWGFIANAIVYLVVGGLAVRWAIGDGGRITDPDGVFTTILRSSGGKPFLIALAAGFFSYALWRFLAAVFDGDGDGTSASGVAGRVFGLIKGCAYAALGVDALRFAVGGGAGKSGFPKALVTTTAGHVVLFVIAAGILVFAAFEMYRAYGGKLSQGLRLYQVNAHARQWIVGVSRFGIGARAVVIGTFGVLMIRAILGGHPGRTPGTTDSIHTAGQSEPILYLGIGAGLMAYGVYLLVLSKYRRVRAA